MRLTGGPAKPAGPGGPVSPLSPCENTCSMNTHVLSIIRVYNMSINNNADMRDVRELRGYQQLHGVPQVQIHPDQWKSNSTLNIYQWGQGIKRNTTWRHLQKWTSVPSHRWVHRDPQGRSDLLNPVRHQAVWCQKAFIIISYCNIYTGLYLQRMSNKPVNSSHPYMCDSDYKPIKTHGPYLWERT